MSAPVPGPCLPECEKEAVGFVDVSFPVEVTPDICVRDIRAEVCGRPTVVCRDYGCCNSCEVVVTQKVKLRFSVRYGIRAEPGEAAADCCR